MPALKVLFATSEVAPLIKTGGLADVSAALPAALRKIDVDARVLIPGYSSLLSSLTDTTMVAAFDNLVVYPAARLLQASMQNSVPIYVLDCPEMYQRDGGPYQDSTGHDWADNALRFGLLSRVAAMLGSEASPLAWHPDVLHCNDWQTGLAPAYLKFSHGAVPSLMTVHNLAFQGIFPFAMMAALDLPDSCFNINGVEYFGNLSFLKAGLFYADHLSTVSPNYANEIQQEALGFGLQGLLAGRRDDITGILNGIDIDEWNPATDAHLAETYSFANLNGKLSNKQALQRRLGLTVDPTIPLLGVISRLTHQKGLDLLLEIASELTALPAQLALLGSGELSMQNAALDLSRKHPGKIAAVIDFDESLAHQIEAGADMFVMPSRFEPCGLNQLYSQRYGTPPIVHATGGLVDSVVDCTPATLMNGTASGFVFDNMTAKALTDTIQRAVGYYQDRHKWRMLCNSCMGKELGWKTSAESYRKVYLKMLGK